MLIVSNIIYAIAGIHCSLQVTQSVVALHVLPKSKCFWYSVTIQRPCWATLILATKLLYTKGKHLGNHSSKPTKLKMHIFYGLALTRIESKASLYSMRCTILHFH